MMKKMNYYEFLNLKKALSDEIKIIYWKQVYPSQTQ